ncbi:hypothetical protein DH2020_046779 [Rehmannia glutinosa]|uniref:Transferase n=1 Tax=Rehmannia glutinosa TaxID=99300 RepID=A0ABR0UB84_REHGL
MAEVSFICKRTVVSTKPVQPGKFSPLSSLDRVMERNHLRLVFYYDFPTKRRSGEVTKKLRDSISEMLSAFPIVTGRLLRTPDGRWMIKCNDAGLRMVEARVKGSVFEWLQNVDREKELKLVHWEQMFHKPYFWSTFYVQVKGMKTALVDMSICLDMRKVLDLDKGFFGNCMVYNRVLGDGLNENKVSKAAAFIEKAVSEMDGDEVMDLIEWLEREKCKNTPWMNGSHLICVNLENVDSYSAVFEGNVSPIRVSYYIEPAVGSGQIVILPSPGGDGPYSRVVAVTLPEDEAEKLLEDALIQKFAPTILVGLKKSSLRWKITGSYLWDRYNNNINKSIKLQEAHTENPC